ncbi:hypothetical protein PCANC_05116 [Puccinia coronata f. sp. avenae]|uniref:Uncharacterized protein n=1 Tax=Puccinia coronata f. sp. avenae TaxID=200324 RepID=A0A2N5W348_9BASI|nr:hypothetical protein PCANC_05116 [Puccinia coronata f. sp. avenae]
MRSEDKHSRDHIAPEPTRLRNSLVYYPQLHLSDMSESESAQAPVLAAAALCPPGLASRPQAQSELTLKQYNGALYKWTQQLLLHTHANVSQAASPSPTATTKSTVVSKMVDFPADRSSKVV